MPMATVSRSPPSAPRPAPAARLIVPVCGLLGVCFAGFLYSTDTSAYYRLLTAWMLAPFPHPFIDWEWIPSAVECWRKGVDVYVDNTCYLPVAHGRHNYSPLWLRATFLPSGAEWVMPFGLMFAVLFFVCIGSLPAPRRRRDIGIMLLASLSSLVAFALERANADVALFILITIGVHLWGRGLAWRLSAYTVFAFVGLLKFYPLVLFVMAVRERIGAFLAISIALCVTIAVFIYELGSEMSRATGSIPGGSYFTDMFGAVNLPYGLLRVALAAFKSAHLPGLALLDSIERPVARALLCILIIEAIARAVWLAGRGRLRTGLADMPSHEIGFLVAGAALVCGCFFAGQSVGYRSIFLLLALPGLLRLSQTLPDRASRGVLLATCIAVVFVMWVLTIQFFLFIFGLSDVLSGAGGPIGALHWLAHELAWWWIIGVLLSVLLSFVANSQVWTTVCQVLGLSPSGPGVANPSGVLQALRLACLPIGASRRRDVVNIC